MDLYDELRRLVDELSARGADYALCGGLARMKRVAGRAQDLADLERLEGGGDAGGAP